MHVNIQWTARAKARTALPALDFLIQQKKTFPENQQVLDLRNEAGIWSKRTVPCEL